MWHQPISSYLDFFFFFHTCSSSYSYWLFKLQLKLLKTWIWTRIRIRIKIMRPLLACNYPPIISQKLSQNFNWRLSTWWTRTPSRQPCWWECFECEISTSGNGSIQTRTWNSSWRQPLIKNLRPLLAGNLFTLDWFFLIFILILIHIHVHIHTLFYIRRIAQFRNISILPQVRMLAQEPIPKPPNS